MQLLASIFVTLSTFLSFTSVSVTASPFNSSPIPCSQASHDPTKWTHLHGVRALERCQQPVLFDTTIFAPVDDPNTQITSRSCKASEMNTTHKMEYSPAPITFGSLVQRRQLNASTSLNSTSLNKTSSYIKFAITPKGCKTDAAGIQNQTSIHIFKFRYGRDGILGDKSDISTAI